MEHKQLRITFEKSMLNYIRTFSVPNFKGIMLGKTTKFDETIERVPLHEFYKSTIKKFPNEEDRINTLEDTLIGIIARWWGIHRSNLTS